MFREIKDEVEKAVQNEQECRLCNFQTSRRRIGIHVRQHTCMHSCHCGYQHVNRDQIAEHQKLPRRLGMPGLDARSTWCQVISFQLLRRWAGQPVPPSDLCLPPLRRRATQQLSLGLVFPRTHSEEWQQPQPCAHSPHPQGTRFQDDHRPVRLQIPAANQPSLLPALRHCLARQRFFCRKVRALGGGGRRWRTHTSPQIEVVEANARTTLERLLGCSEPSRSIPGLRTWRAAILQTDTDDLEDRACRVDATRRRFRLSRAEEDVLRREAAKLHPEGARFRHLCRPTD